MEKHDPTDVAMQALGRRIAEVRHRKDVTQEVLAARIATSEKYVQHIERGRANPSARLVFRIASALGVEPAELFMLPESMERARPGRPPRRPRNPT